MVERTNLHLKILGGCEYTVTSQIGEVKGGAVIYDIKTKPELHGQIDTVTLTNCYGSVTKQVRIPKENEDNGGTTIGTDNGDPINVDAGEYEMREILIILIQ